MSGEDLEARVRLLESQVAEMKSRLDQATKVPIQASDHTPVRWTAPPAQDARKKINLEDFLGANVLARAGSVALLLALAWFIKLAIDRQWINESMRIALGYTGGLGLAGWAFWLSKSKAGALSYTLLGGALGAFYISAAAAHYFYNLLPLKEVFLCLALISAGAAWQSIRSGSEILYAFSYLGAVAAPLLLSRGENSYQFYFSYLSLVQLGFFFVSRKTSLRYTSILVLFLGYLLFILWAWQDMKRSSFPIPFAYLTILFLTLHLQQNRAASSGVFEKNLRAIFTLLNAIFYQGATHVLTEHFYPQWLEHQYLLTALFLILPVVLTAERFRTGSGPAASMGFALALSIAALARFSDSSYKLYFTMALAGSLVLFSLLYSKEETISIRIIGYVMWIPALIAGLFFLQSQRNMPIWNSRLAGLLMLALFALANAGKSKDWLARRIFGYAALGIMILALFKENHDHIHLASQRNLGYTWILGTSAGLLLATGFAFEKKTLRQAGLLVALVTAAKFFAWDILKMSTGIKIIAGLSVGTGLIIAGIYYQRLRNAAALLLLLVLPFLPSQVLAEKIRPESFLYFRQVKRQHPEPRSDCGVVTISPEVYAASAPFEFRLAHGRRAIPYRIKSSELNPDSSGQLALQNRLFKREYGAFTHVVEIPDPPPQRRVTHLVMGSKNQDGFEASIRLDTSKDGSSWNYQGSHSLYNYGSNSMQKIRLPENTRFARLEYYSQSALKPLHALYEAERQPEVEIPNASFLLERDDDNNSSVIRIANELRVQRIALSFKEMSYTRSILIEYYDETERKFIELLRSTISRKEDKSIKSEIHSIELPQAAPGEIKVHVVNNDDEPLTLEKLRLFVQEEELVFSHPEGEDFQKSPVLLLYYGNRYQKAPAYDFDPDNCSARARYILEKQQNNPGFAYSYLEPPLSVWILRVLFVVLFALVLVLGYFSFRNSQHTPAQSS